jgi:ribose 5-phosphate isomerase A
MGPVRATAPSPVEDSERFKRAAAKAAAQLVADGMSVGLGTGSTVAHLLPALAQRGLNVQCVATSPATERQALELGLELRDLDELGALDIAIDGADQLAPDGWLIKGGGGAHTREKIVARAARRFVVIVSAEKVVEALRPPVPLELLRFGAHATLAAIGDSMLRDCPPSPDGNPIADYNGSIGDARELAERLSTTPGVVDHGLFAPEMVTDILIGGPAGVEHRTTKGDS